MEEVNNKKNLSSELSEQLLIVLKTRFEKNRKRHKDIEWSKVQAKLMKDSYKMWSLDKMEQTGGEPDVVGYDNKTDEYIFFDCSAESKISLTLHNFYYVILSIVKGHTSCVTPGLCNII